MAGAIDTSRFIQVGINGIYGKPVSISPFELQDHNNKNYENTHFQLLREGIYMPTPRIFTTHFNNVIDAKNNKKTLLFADGTKVPKNLIEDMYGHQTGPRIDIYKTGAPGAWTWLNARFAAGNLETVVGIKGTELKLKTEKLKRHYQKESYVELSFNSQGLPTSRYYEQEYKPGKNIYYFPPQNGGVAGFDADSDRARLFCDWNPSVTYASLGVFACAEGTPKILKAKTKQIELYTPEQIKGALSSLNIKGLEQLILKKLKEDN